MLTGEQVCLGLAGAFIVNDTEETALGLVEEAVNDVMMIENFR